MRKTIPPLPTSGGGGMLVPACLWALLLAGMLATCVLVGCWSEPGANPQGCLPRNQRQDSLRGLSRL
jgi:hypothetical protein